MSHVEAVISDILRREGDRFTDDPHDRGGCTRWGVTLEALREHRDAAVTCEDVAKLAEDEARAIYRKRLLHFEAVTHPELFALVADSSVNHGQSRATAWLQQALGIDADGVIGPYTRATLAAADPGVVYRRYLGIRAEFYGAIVTRNPSQAKFALGWLRRLREFIERTP